MDRTLDRVTLIAEDLGRLRRMGVDHYALERLGHHLDTLDAMLRPTAGLLVKTGMPVLRALGQVDRERAQLRHRLGLDQP